VGPSGKTEVIRITPLKAIVDSQSLPLPLLFIPVLRWAALPDHVSPSWYATLPKAQSNGAYELKPPQLWAKITLFSLFVLILSICYNNEKLTITKIKGDNLERSQCRRKEYVWTFYLMMNKDMNYIWLLKTMQSRREWSEIHEIFRGKTKPMNKFFPLWNYSSKVKEK
jgi:hypothetical protein